MLQNPSSTTPSDPPSLRKQNEVGNARFPSIIITDQVSLVLRVKYLDSRPSTFITLPLNFILKVLLAFSGMYHSLSIGVEAHLLQLSTPVVFVWITGQNRADSLFGELSLSDCCMVSLPKSPGPT